MRRADFFRRVDDFIVLDGVSCARARLQACVCATDSPSRRFSCGAQFVVDCDRVAKTFRSRDCRSFGSQNVCVVESDCASTAIVFRDSDSFLDG